MDLVLVGTLRRPHGLSGEVVLEGSSLTPEELRAVGTFRWRNRAGEERALSLEGARGAHDRVLIRFEGFHDRDAAATLAPGELLAERDLLPDPGEGTAYTFQLVGLKVVERDGRELGEIAAVMKTGAHPVWVVRGQRELLIPAAPEVVRKIDLGAGLAVVALPAGLEEL